ncbi:hypothetical protein M9Y10_022064 [Tritrichomonas musculus]|uniref:Uncharacterized protein n=1 Tax=Tritrichomonas musculus TaxID=1915356 RepID=A0ABR2KR89_9EUKA
MKSNAKLKKNCQELINKFNKSKSDLPPIINELCEYIPEFTKLIISEIFQKIINYLSMGNVPEEIIGCIFDMILKMLEKVDASNPETDPYPTIFSDPEFLTGLFMHTGLNEDDKFDHRVIDIIYHLFLKGPEKMISFLATSKASVDPLMKGLTRKGIRDDKAANLFNQIFVCHPSISNLLIEDVIPLIRKFPPGLVIDLMIRSPQIKSTMTEEEFKQWLLDQETFTLSDVHQVFILYSSLWQDSLTSILILRSRPSEKLYFIKWIHDMPSLEIEISEELTKEAVMQIVNPKYEFQIIIDETSNPKEIDTRNLYLFPRLFVLSLSNPAHVEQSDFPKLYELLFEKNDYVAAAAIQVVTLWIVKYNFIVDYRITYRVAEIVELIKPSPLRTLYQILIHFIGTQNKVPEMILRTDPAMRYNPQNAKKAKVQSWEFPNFSFIFDNVPSYDKYDQNKMLMLLGDISQYLGLIEEEDGE